MGPFDKLIPRSALEGRETGVAIVLTVIWVLLLVAYGAGYFGLFGDVAEPRDAALLEVLFFLIVLILPIALVWLMTAMMKRSFEIQDEARRLERQVRDLQAGGRPQAGVSQPRIKDNRIEGLQERVTELTAHVKKLESAIQSMRKVQAGEATQSSFTFEGEEEEETASTLDWSDLIKALDFPRDEKDSDGFRALRTAKKDENAGQLLRAAEDMLNLLAQEGIYMDDFRPKIAPARDWRLFAQGQRGEPVALVGAILDEEALERVEARNKRDQIFRDAALYFLRRFDILLRSLQDSASDGQIQALADTRTGRAFMLLARSAGMFG